MRQRTAQQATNATLLLANEFIIDLNKQMASRRWPRDQYIAR